MGWDQLGDFWVNAPTESWLNSFKSERYHGMRYKTHAEIKAAVFEYIEVFYNRKRQHSTLGYKSPIQFFCRRISEQYQEKKLHRNHFLVDEVSMEPPYVCRLCSRNQDFSGGLGGVQRFEKFFAQSLQNDPDAPTMQKDIADVNAYFAAYGVGGAHKN